VLNHLLLLVLDHNVEKEATPQVEDNHAPHETNTVLHVKWLHLPVGVTNRVLEETSDVLESSPSLGLVSRLLRVVHKLAEIAISVLG